MAETKKIGEIIEESQAQIMQFELAESPIPTITNDLSNGRWYSDTNENLSERVYIPSVTTILQSVNKGLGYDMWLGNALSYKHAMDYANEMADIGSIVHALCMRLVLGGEVDTSINFVNDDESVVKLDNRVTKRLHGFMDFIKDYKPMFEATEISLYCPIRDKSGDIVFNWAGQADDVLVIDDKRILLDIKTGKEYPTHSLQLTAYKMLWDVLFPDQKIHELWGLYLPENYRTKSYKIVKYKFEPEMWLNTYELWIWLNSKKGKMPTPVFRKEFETNFKITNDLYEEDKEDAKTNAKTK